MAAFNYRDRSIRHKLLTMARKRSLMSDAFDKFMEQVFPSAPADQVAAMKMAFFAGAGEFHAVQVSAVEDGQNVTLQDIDFFHNIVDEIEVYYRNVIATSKADTGKTQ